jgi:integrase
MTRHARLWKRHGVYYHRAKVPADIAATYGKAEETFSLGTKDYHEAVRRLRVAASLVDSKFDSHRKSCQAPAGGFTTPNLSFSNIAVQAPQRSLSIEVKRNRIDTMQPLEHEIETFANGIYEQIHKNHRRYQDEVNQHCPHTTEEKLAGYYGKAASDLQACQTRIMTGELQPWVNNTLDDTIDILGLSNSAIARPLRDKFVNAIHQAELKAFEEIFSRYRGLTFTEDSATGEAITPEPQKVSPAHLLSDVVPLFLEDRKGNWTQATYAEHQKELTLFTELVGNKPIDAYKKKDARGFKTALQTLPRNWRNNKQLQGLPAPEAVKRAKELHLIPIAAKTGKKRLEFVSTFFKWASCNYDEVTNNIFDGITIKVSSNVRDERHPLSKAQIQTILQSPLYTGCNSLSKPYLKGGNIYKHRAIYWVFPIGIYTGLRLNEILQLHTDDIKQQDGIAYFDINDEGEKRLKTRSSRRRIPIHSRLIEMGLHELVKHCKANDHNRLFPDEIMGSDGTYSSKFSSRINRFLDNIGVKTDSKICFHSTRHNFEDACREANMDYEVMNTLQGHAMQGMSARYGSGVSLKKLNKEINKISYDY